MEWKSVDSDFLNYMREHEPKIPNHDYGEYAMKPFFGTLFEKGDLCYVVAVSSPKPRHQHMKNNKDFKKLYDEKGMSIGVINLNYMFPVPKKYLIAVKYKDIEKYRKFKRDTEKSKYINLLRKQITVINTKGFDVAAVKLYDFVEKFPMNYISKRCFNYRELERSALEFFG
jgi:hypothetical protein